MRWQRGGFSGAFVAAARTGNCSKACCVFALFPDRIVHSGKQWNHNPGEPDASIALVRTSGGRFRRPPRSRFFPEPGGGDVSPPAAAARSAPPRADSALLRFVVPPLLHAAQTAPATAPDHQRNRHPPPPPPSYTERGGPPFTPP